MDCFKSNGKDQVETRAVSEFTTVKVFDKIDLELIKGNEYKIEVFAYRHIIKNISTEVKAGVLSVKNNNTCNFVRGYKKRVLVKITLPQLLRVENWGVGITRFAEGFTGDVMNVVAESSGDIYVNGNFKKLSTYSNGNGDIYLNGSSDSLSVYMRGTNFLHGKGFKVNEYVLTETQSMGDCFLNISDVKKFEYAIYKNGNIYYKGNPSEIRKLNTEPAKGKLVKED